MTNEKAIKNIIALESHEKIAQAYYEKYGAYLDFSQFLLLFQNPEKQFTPEQLNSPESRQQQRTIHSQFNSLYGTLLSEENFLIGDKDIELEQLQRYINIPPHSHNFTECIFVLNGYCDHIVENQVYRHQQGNVSIIVPNVMHHLLPSPDCLCLTVKIRNRAFNTMDFPHLPHLAYPISFQIGQDSFIFNSLLAIYSQQIEQPPFAERLMLLLFQSIMIYICQNYWETMHHLTPLSVQNPQIVEITNYIFENYQTVTLLSLAEHFHFNPSYLSTMIKQQTGTSFTNILRDIRMKHATRLLIQSTMSVNHICTEIGYQDVSQFISNFRKFYGHTPVQYRNKYKRISE